MGIEGNGSAEQPGQRARRRSPWAWGRRGPATTPTEPADEGAGAERDWPEDITVDPEMAERMAENRRRREERREAEAELLRLRARHWSGERIIEESRTPMEWWEHPDADPYAVLGIFPGATLEEASHARRKIASENHPDLVPAHHALAVVRTRRMVAANAAYDRLKRALLAHQIDDPVVPLRANQRTRATSD